VKENVIVNISIVGKYLTKYKNAAWQMSLRVKNSFLQLGGLIQLTRFKY
jgi:hypothetical protein